MKQSTFCRIFPVLLISLIFPADNQTFTLKSDIGPTQVLSFSIEQNSIHTENGISKILPDHVAKTMDAGYPELPVFSTFFIKEPGKEYSFQLEIKNSSVLEDITPVSAQILPENMNEPFSMDVLTDYSSKLGTYPENVLSTSQTLNMRGAELIQLSLVPYQYNFDTSSLEIYEDVEIIVTESDNSNNENRNERLPSRAFEQLLGSISVNYSPRDAEEYQQPAILYICGGNTLSNPIFQALIEWRREQGYVVYTASSDEMNGDQSAIKAYIQDAYDNFSPPPEFVGLVGDNGGAYNIPTFFEDWSTCSFNQPCYGEGDYPYAQLEGDDVMSDVLIGRLSVRNSTDLGIVAAKTIDYEKGVNADEGWFEKAGFGANPDVSGTGLSIVITNEYLHELALSYGMENSTLMVRNTSAQISSWLNAQLSAGVSYLNFRGLYGPASFDTDIIFNGLSSRPILPFVTFITCGTGSFAYEVAAPIERFIRSGISPANYSGGVAAIGTATYGTHTPFNNIIDMGIYHGIFAQGIETAGGALASGELAMMNTYPSNPSHYVDIFTHWNNLMGDPALRLWTDTPDLFELDHSEVHHTASDIFPVTVTDGAGNPVEGARVAVLMDNSDIPLLKISDANGTVHFTDIDNSASSFKVTATKRNYFPEQNTVNISSEGGLLQIADPLNIIDIENGNGDGVLSPGETAELLVELDYFGEELTESFDLFLQTSSNYINIVDGQFTILEIAEGESVICNFMIEVNSDAPNLEEPAFQLWIPEGQLPEYYLQFELTILAPQLDIVQFLPDGMDTILPGDEISLPIILSNLGLMETGGISGILTSNQPEIVSISSESCSWVSLVPGNTAWPSDEPVISISQFAILGTEVQFQLQLSSTSGLETIIQITLPIGQPGIQEPAGPDEYGYYIYGIEDQYTLAPDYFWMEIDPDYGGEGIGTSMVDCGVGLPGNQLSEVIDLPFPFTFYGIEYNSITVSTNGWISLGETQMESFRNTMVPGPGGPAPMIAAFWDDLKTKGESGGCTGPVYGDVYYFTDPLGKYFIIEWSELKTHLNDDEETFQLVMFNTSENTPTGDDEILIQYKEFNNTSDGIYLPSYQGLLHGAYSTIGLEDHTQTQGIQYTFNNIYHDRAETLSGGKSVFITTRLPYELFYADETFGEPSLTVSFHAHETGDNITNYWDVNDDGEIDASGNTINYTFSEYGHYTITMIQEKDGVQKSEYKLNYIHIVPYGCTDPVAENYDPDAEYNDGTCEYTWGCMDPYATNYNHEATRDDGNCYYMNYEDLTVDNIYFNARMGCDVDMDGQFIIMGAYNDSTLNMMSTGGAYIFEKNSSSGWEVVQKLTAYDPESLDYYGYAVSLDNDIAVVAAYKDDNERGYDAGAVYVYRKDITGYWEFEDKIMPADGVNSDNFGFSVKLSGDCMVVGSRKSDIDGHNNQGAAYIYCYEEIEGWTLYQKITSVDGEAGDSFGAAVDITSEYIVVGANLADSGNNNNTGGAYVFEKNFGGEWYQSQELIPSSNASQDQFGYSLAITDDHIVVSMPFANTEGYSNSGAAILFYKPGDEWIIERILESEFPQSNNNFGLDLAINEPYLAVHSGSNLVLLKRQSDLHWFTELEFQTPVIGPIVIQSGDLLTAEQVTSTARIYSLDDWEEWLDVPGPGDMNDDEFVDILDIIILVSYVMGEINLSPDQMNSAEVTGDGFIDILDIVYIVSLILAE